MARGTIFQFTTDPDLLGSMFESDFYDKANELSVDYVKENAPEDAAHDTENLRKALEYAGFPVSTDPVPDADEQPAFVIGPMSAERLIQVKENYFASMFNELKARVANLSLTEFADTGFDPYAIRSRVEDTYGDIVCDDTHDFNCIKTMHRFIRDMEPGTTYYVAANTIFMH